jgi:DNA-directed RNA polymerase specialized sigma24 family protein
MGQGLQTGQWFMATQWSVVLRARDGNFQESQEALQALVRCYAGPVHNFIRCHEKLPHEDCEDLAQEFFSQFVHKEWLKHLAYEKSFRGFLRTFLKRFLADARDRRLALKRGGGQSFVPLTTPEGAECQVPDQAGSLAPDEAYDRKWAETVFCETARKLKAEYYERGKGALYEVLKDIVPGHHGQVSYAELGTRLAMTEQAIKSSVLRYRNRAAELLRAEVAATVKDPADIDAELHYLVGLLAR